VNPPRNRKGETGNPPPTANASDFYPNPSLARSLLTVLSRRLVTQIFAPSKAAYPGIFPTGNVPSNVPSLARILETELVGPPTAQMFCPSNARPLGRLSIGNVSTRFALYQRSKLIG